MAKFLGWSTFLSNITAIWYDSNWKGMVVNRGVSASSVSGISITWSAISFTVTSPSVTMAIILPLLDFISWRFGV